MLIVSIALLLALTVMFSGIVFYLHARNERRGRRFASLEDEWEPALLEALVDGPSAFPAERLVTASQQLHFVWYLVMFARRLRGEEQQVLMELAAPYLPSVATRARSGNAEVRARAIQTLVTLGMPAYADVVVAALDDESPLVAMTAARGLARPKYAVHAEAVIRRMHRFGEWNRRFLASMLSMMGEPALPTLRVMLADEAADSQSRAVAADALTQLRDLGAAETCAHILTATPDRELLAAALGLLATVGHSGHLAAVLPLLDSPEPWVRAQALETVARLGSIAEVPLLTRGLDDPSPWVALRAAYGLHELGAVAELRQIAAGTDARAGVALEVLSMTPA